MPQGGERRVDSSARADPSLDKAGHKEEGESGGQESKPYVVHTRKGHIRRVNYEGDQSVAKAPHYGGYDKEKDHDEGVCCHNDVVKLIVP